jgi:uncharacterized membrane protein YqjE
VNDPAPSPGLAASLRRLAIDIAALFATRAELASLELQQTRERVLRWAAMIAVAAVLLLAALVTLAVWVAAIFWDGPRGWALGLLTVAYVAGGAGLVVAVLRGMRDSPPMFAQTLAELRKDRDALRRRAVTTAQSSDSRDDRSG